ncbi:MAG: DUF4417 domain-containing protein [Coriobacteriales bacterium]|jgi:hypothetical protein|nr:DUF4417 domain-containing protein [Coriobacteriales bacterium]
MQTLEETLEPFFIKRFPTSGRFGMPLVCRQDIMLEDFKLIRFSSIVKAETQDTDATVHFFEYDNRFDEVWKKPEAYVGELGQYRQVMTPDFSLYSGIVPALQIFNTFKNRWCGALWQSMGLTVIPSVSWNDKSSFDFCFDGIEEGAVVAVSTLGTESHRWSFMRGFQAMSERIHPRIVVCYGEAYDEMYEYADFIEVPYQRTRRVAQATRVVGA